MIEIKNLFFGYTEYNALFKDLTLSLEKGKICGLLGKNGAGKTTLLKIIAGLIFRGKGICEVMGHSPEKRLPSFLSEIFFLPEDLFVPESTADQYVKYYSSFYPKFDLTLFRECMTEFHLPHDKLLTEFSHGQKKKFLIAFGLSTNCRLYILDEPTNGLDIPSKSQCRKLLASNISDEKCFIISTHQVRDVENLIDSILILDEGKIIFQQSLFEVTQQFAFIHQKQEPDPAECFFYEKHLGGYTAMIHNMQSQETKVDLEILFNAILSNKPTAKKLTQGTTV